MERFCHIYMAQRLCETVRNERTKYELTSTCAQVRCEKYVYRAAVGAVAMSVTPSPPYETLLAQDNGPASIMPLDSNTRDSVCDATVPFLR